MSYESYKWKGGDLITVNQMNRIEQGVLEMNEAYVPTVWQTGDTVTAEKLNKIEQGIAEGGGSGGDFSTAEVTVTVNDGAESTINMPIIYDSEYSALLTLIPLTGTSTYTVPLFKGEADISVVSQGVSITTTGSIEYVSADGYIAVTGDGSITISEA